MGYGDRLTGGHPVVDDITRELNQVPDQGRYLGGSHGAVGSCTRSVSMSGPESELDEVEQLARLSASRAPRERIVHMFNLRILGGTTDKRVGCILRIGGVRRRVEPRPSRQRTRV